jgi:hypothetical protein
VAFGFGGNGSILCAVLEGTAAVVEIACAVVDEVLKAETDAHHELTIFYRALVALADITPMISFRSSIGIGEIAVENKKDSYSQDGKAFHRSRDGIHFFRSQKVREKRRTRIVTGDRGLCALCF